MTRFASPWDRSLRVTTAVFSAILLAVPAAVVWLGRGAGAPALAAVAAVSLLVLAATWALAPRAFSLEGGLLRVERPLLAPEIPLAEVRAASLLPEGALRCALRLGGTSGLFGHTGAFWSRRLGRFRMYATRRSRLVLVETARTRYVLSPEPPGAFLEALLARAPRASAEPLPGAGARLPRAAWLWPLAGAGLALAAGGAVVLGSLAWAPVSIRAEGDRIVVERRWAGAVSIPLASVREAGPLPPGAFRGAVRTRGAAGLGDAAYGEFRSPALGPFRLYACKLGPYLLVDTDAELLVLTPDDPDRFLDALRAARPGG